MDTQAAVKWLRDPIADVVERFYVAGGTSELLVEGLVYASGIAVAEHLAAMDDPPPVEDVVQRIAKWLPDIIRAATLDEVVSVPASERSVN